LYSSDANFTVDNLNPVHNNMISAPAGGRTKSLQERCGINTTFPGITEYMKRYNRKPVPEKITAFQINPAPDFTLYDRPTAQVSANRI